MHRLVRILCALSLAAPATAVAAEPTPASEPVLLPGSVRLHIVIDGPRGETMTLFRHTGSAWAVGPNGTVSAASSAVVCAQPCGVPVDATSGTYYLARPIDGPAIHSKPFSLAGYGPDVTARVRPGNRGAYIVGFTLATMGAMFAVLGATFMGLSAKSSDDGKHKALVTGGAFLGAGVGALIFGIPLAVRGRTRARLSSGRP